ncbi:MAG: hypothetical protein GWN86_00815 [Desulfobacterales bacterium]|nr:hypothetical protein [Desulfobacterales bacterium]
MSLDEEVECVDYQVNWENVILGSIFIETIVVPIWLFGFELYEPTGVTLSCAMEDTSTH